ncbi:hypothetical protein Bbelb_011290 [Branchiostoma belcheri]|nr:hypothetical protein Bbelb_011290 [Branchiostoma belcheri]
MSKFARRRSVKVTFLELQDSQLKDVIDLLTKHGVSALEIEGIQRKNRDSCEITFKTQATLQRVTPSLTSDSAVDVETFGNGVTMVTAVGIPVEMDDNFIRLRLKEYGVVVDGIFRTYANLGFPDIKTGTRQYKMKLAKHLPNTIRIGQDIVSFRYVGQPKQCHRCGSEEHFVAACKADKCGRCHAIGHKSQDCTAEIKCNACGGEGHTSRACTVSFASRLALGTAWTKAPTPQAAALTLTLAEPAAGKSLVEGVSDSESESSGEESRESSDSEEEETIPKGARPPPIESLPKNKSPQERDTPASLKADESLPEDGANKMPESTPEKTEPGDSLGLMLEESGELVIDENPPEPEGTGDLMIDESEGEVSAPQLSKRPHSSEHSGADESSDSSGSVSLLESKHKTKKPKKVEEEKGQFGSQIDMFPSSPEASQQGQPPRTHDRDKRNLAFDLCKQVDVAALQECHVSTLKEKKEWTRQWGGRAIWSLGTNSARGVGILLSPKVRLLSHRSDTEGRVVSALLEVDEKKYNLVNLYAPGTPAERAEFFASIHQYMYSNAALIITGDFNCTLDSDMDRHPVQPSTPRSRTQDIVELQSLCEDLGLVDVWRRDNPGKRDFTWRSKSNAIMSRLDRFYIADPLTCTSVIQSCPFSDHDTVLLNVTPTLGVKRGPGVWKCNTNVLKDPLFEKEFVEEYQNWREDIPSHDDLRSWWEDVKTRSKNLIILHSKRRAKNERLIERDLASRVDQLRSRLNSEGECPDTVKLYEEARERLNKTVLDRLEGQRLRSKVRSFEEDEKPSRFFFKTEREKGARKVVQEIRNPEGDTVSSREGILDTFEDFYSNLYRAGETDGQEQASFLDHLEASLSDSSRNFLDRPLSLEELGAALKEMAHSKTPGSDGLPMEFYQQFWPTLGQDLLDVLNEGLNEGLLSTSQREGVVTLLDKKGDPLDPANKRPISLLNVDYKILSKTMTNRLKSVVSEVVHTDQSCGIPGRTIEDSTTLLRDIAAYVDSKNSPCVLIALDQEKAFDRVDHKYLIEVLGRLGFGPTYTSWVETLYTSVCSKILVNGDLTSSIPIGRGVRQGCPLSPLLYVLCIEPLAAAIRADKDIKGVQVPGGSGQETKLVQYADDNTCVLSDEVSINRTFDTLKRFETATGSKLNFGKTKALWMGSWKGRQDQPFPIGGWSSSHLTILGAPVGNLQLAEQAWLQRFAKFKDKLVQWKDRVLTLFGKALVLNSLALATLWYVAPVYPLPNSVRKKIEKAMFDFLWDGKTEMVKRETLYLPKEEGGLGLVSIQHKANALLLKSVKKALMDPHVPTSCYTHYWLGLSLRRIDPSTWRNSAPHAMERPPHYEYIFQLLQKLESQGIIIDWESCTTASLYTTLLMSEGTVPKCVREDPNRDWAAVWKAVHNPLLQKWDRMLAWHTAHGSLKTRRKLKSWRNFVADDTCPRDNCVMSEDVTHLFWECSVPAELWNWVQGLIHRRILAGFMMPGAFALLGQVFQAMPRRTRQVLEAIAAIARSVIWRSRCDATFERKQTSGQDLIHRMEIRLTERLHFEFERLGPGRFYEVWAEGHSWVDVDATHCTGARPPPKESLPRNKSPLESDNTPASLKADESLPEDGANKMPESTPERTEPGDSLGLMLEESDELVIDENPPDRPNSSEAKRQHSSESEDSSGNIKEGKVKGKKTKKTVVESDGESTQIELYPSSADDQQVEQKQKPPHSHRRRGGRNGHKH